MQLKLILYLFLRQLNEPPKASFAACDYSTLLRLLLVTPCKDYASKIFADFSSTLGSKVVSMLDYTMKIL